MQETQGTGRVPVFELVTSQALVFWLLCKEVWQTWKYVAQIFRSKLHCEECSSLTAFTMKPHPSQWLSTLGFYSWAISASRGIPQMGTCGLGTLHQDGQNFLRTVLWSETLPTRPFLPSLLWQVLGWPHKLKVPPAYSCSPPTSSLHRHFPQ